MFFMQAREICRLYPVSNCVSENMNAKYKIFLLINLVSPENDDQKVLETEIYYIKRSAELKNVKIYTMFHLKR